MAGKLNTLIRDKRGNSVIEFSLVLPLLLLVCFGITEFGRAWMTMNILTSAAREGVRLAVVTAPDVPAVQQRVRDVCAAAGVTPTAITVVPPNPADPDRRVSVTVETDFVVIPGQILGTFNGTIPLRTTTIMRHEAL
ncbi:MAG TPA: TadE/TadG family type IV pilus assembly protein [Candidatus Krumholzibacteria bacterium]|nr:TadE/TadG family type IV pilus assembly protein [Candidatus Krumholzibacteria bacterium]